MTVKLSFASRSPVGSLVLALSRSVPELGAGVDHVLDDDDNDFVVFDDRSNVGRVVGALIDLIDERAEMREAAST